MRRLRISRASVCRSVTLAFSVWCSSLSALDRCGADQPERSKPPNIVLILCDNLGYGDIEAFGSPLQETPCLNRMAREGRRFTHFYATAGVCTPSRASLMTGCYAQRINLHTNPRDGRVLRPVSPYGLHPDEVTIAEILRQQGYATAIVGKWHLGDQSPFLPHRQGFDYFFGIPYSDDMTQAVGRRLGPKFDGQLWPPLPLMLDENVVEAPVDRHGLTQRYTREAIQFIRRHQDRPFFLFLSHAMPGSTSQPFASEDFRNTSHNGPWGDAVRELDWSTGQILDQLVAADLAKQTLVIWTSDNGAPMTNDRNSTQRGTNRPLFGRGYTTAEGGFRVPMIAWWPSHIPPDSECDELATTMDLLPTAAALSEATLPQNRPIDGHDILKLLTNEPPARSPYQAFFYYEGSQLQAVRSGPWKLFLPLREFTQHPHFKRQPTKQPLLLNVAGKNADLTNYASQHPDVVARLTTLAEDAREILGDGKRLGTQQRPLGHVHDPQPVIMK
jgi:arylsulfatase A